jgi:hypothetical protein
MKSEPARKAHPMTEFMVGDRVRVLTTSATTGLAGRSREGVAVDRNISGGPVVSYLVRIDNDRAKPGLLARAVFSPDELEPEAGSTP